MTPSPQGGARNLTSNHVGYPITSPQDAYPVNASGVIYGLPTRSGPVVTYTPADHHYYRSMLFDLGFGGEEHHGLTTNDGLRDATYGDGLTTHYTQYPYGPTQPLSQVSFVGG